MYTTCLIPLDNSEFDRHIIASMDEIRGQLSIQELVYVHVDQYAREKATRPELKSAKSQDLKAYDYLTQHEPCDGSREGIECLELEGSAEKVLTELVEDRQADLVCAGLINQGGSYGQVGRRLLCMTNADVLFIPKTITKKIKKILVPVDLSNTSREVVIKTQKLFPEAEIHLCFVNYIPSVVVMPEAERKQLIKESAKNINLSMQHFVESINSQQNSLYYEYEMSEHFNAGIAIHEHSVNNNFELVAIGRISKLDKELPFLGSVTEKLLSLSNNIPVLVLNH